MTNNQINISELLSRANQVGKISGDVFGDNLFVETQAIIHAHSKNTSSLPALLLLVDGLDTVARENLPSERLSIRESSNTATDSLHELAHAYIAITKAFLGRDQQDSFHRSAIQLLDHDAPANNIASSLRRLTMLPSSGHEHKLGAVHRKAHALKDWYKTEHGSHHDMRHLLHHMIGNAQALGHEVHDGEIQLGSSSFTVTRDETVEGPRYMIVNGDHAATTLISHVNPYTCKRN